MPVLIPEFPLTDDALKAFEGEFQFGSGVLLAITAGHGTLHGHNVPLKGQPDHTSDFDLTPIGENKFKTKSLNAILEFVSDNTGSVQQLVLHEPTHNILARKKVNK